MGKFADAYKEGRDKSASRFEHIVEFESDVPQPYLVQMILGASLEQLLRSAMPFIAQGWEVVSTTAGGNSNTALTTKNLGMLLRMPNPDYIHRTAEGSD